MATKIPLREVRGLDKNYRPICQTAPDEDTRISSGILYPEINIGVPGKALSAICIPPSFQPTGSIDVVLYLHGITSDEPRYRDIRDYWNDRDLPWFLNSYGGRMIMVAPTLGPSAQAGELHTRHFALHYLRQVRQCLVDHGPYQPGSPLPQIGRLILAAHSGGGITMLHLARALAGSIKIPECWGFDCMYGDVEESWLEWAQGDRIFRVFWSSTRARAENIDYLAKKRHNPNVQLEVPFFQERSGGEPVRVPNTPQPETIHRYVPLLYFGECLVGVN